LITTISAPKGNSRLQVFEKEILRSKLLEQVHSNVLNPLIEGYWREKNNVSFSSTRCQEKLIKTLKSQSEVVAATLELIKNEQLVSQASLIYLRNQKVKDYKNESTVGLSTPKRESVMRLLKDTTLNQAT
jgi:hypothetical protein